MMISAASLQVKVRIRIVISVIRIIEDNKENKDDATLQVQVRMRMKIRVIWMILRMVPPLMSAIPKDSG